MKLPLFWASTAWMTGLVAAYYFSLSPGLLLLILLMGLALSKFLDYQKALLLFLSFVLAFFYLSLIEINNRGPYSVIAWHNKGTVELIAEIQVDLGSLEGKYFYLKPLYIERKEVKYGLIQVPKAQLQVFRPGDIIKVEMELTEPPPKTNPGAFSYAEYLYKQGVFALGFPQGKVLKLGEKQRLLYLSIYPLKKKMLNLIEVSIPRPVNGVMKALLLGEREQLPQAWEEDFTRAGINHLLAISGLHVGFVLLIFTGITRLLQLSHLKSNLAVSFLLLVYSMLTGFRPSVFRASLLAIVFLWAPYFKRKAQLLNGLGLAALIDLIIRPYNLFTVGFQLSYFLVLMIIFWTPILQKYLPAAISVSLAAQLASFILSSYYFNQIAPIGIITNLWAIPLAGVIVSLGLTALLLGIIHPLLALPLNRFNYYLLLLLKGGAGIMGNLPGANLEVASPDFFTLSLFLILLLLLPFLLRPRAVPSNKRRQKKEIYLLLSIVIVAVIFYQLIIFGQPPGLEIIFFDVGQGDGILISFPSGERMLIDGGGRAGLTSDQGELVILPYLQQEGIKKLELVAITHFDADHALGVISILKKRQVDTLLLPSTYEENYLARQALAICAAKGIQVRTVSQGDKIKIGEVSLDVLYPEQESQGEGRNNNSIVFKLTYFNFSLLLTGDLEKEGEHSLLSTDYDLKSDILKLGHHGSDTSSSYAFLEEVAAKEAIISVGKNNFGHPSPAVMQRLEELGLRAWRTDDVGAIIVKTDGYNYSISGFKN